jgi:hypothetical protein
VEEPIAVAIQKPPRHPPMTEAEREQYVNCADPLIRAFARREIDVGTRIEVVLARFPKFVENQARSVRHTRRSRVPLSLLHDADSQERQTDYCVRSYAVGTLGKLLVAVSR